MECVCVSVCVCCFKETRREYGESERITGNSKICQHSNKKTGPPPISFTSCHRHSSINEQLGTEWLSVKSKLTPSSLIMSGTSWDRQSAETSCPPVRHCVVQWQESLQRDEAHARKYVHGQVSVQHTRKHNTFGWYYRNRIFSKIQPSIHLRSSKHHIYVALSNYCIPIYVATQWLAPWHKINIHWST